MNVETKKHSFRRRRVMRSLLKNLINLVFQATSDFQIFGEENLPKTGPLLVVSNHFSFIDPVAVIKVSPWKLDFLGGTRTPNAPAATEWLRHLWGFIPVFRGSVSRETFSSSEAILARKGVLGIFPEGGNWANVLRPPRPGVAFLAVRTGAPILPIGLDGFESYFPQLRKGKRPLVTARIGKTFGPYQVDVRGRGERGKLDEIGNEMMQHIAMLIPPEKRGFYSTDPSIREAARGTEIYPWANLQEI